MFSTKDYLERKTGPYGIGRLSYLQSLVTEFQDSDDIEGRQQVIANLANFAYDPINYEFFRQLNILDLFLDGLEESDEQIVEFSIGGICNACLDRQNKEHFISNGAVKLVIKCLSRSSEETVISALTTLMYLMTPASKQEITSIPVVECILRFAESKNKRLSNLAKVFIEDYCSAEQIKAAKDIQQQMMQAATGHPS